MILVTGGTGFVGREVVLALLELGYQVRVLARHPERSTDLRKRPGIEIYRGDALDPATLPGAMRGVSAVIHLIGIIAETSRVSFAQAHVEATRHVLAAAKEAGVTRWVQMSAIGTRDLATSRYHITKWQAEELVRQSGLDWTIIRPSLIYGYDERDRLLNMLRLAVSLPAIPLLNGGSNWIQPVSVREVAHCFARAVASQASIGHEYDLVGPVAFSWRDMIFKIARAKGRSVYYEEIPFQLVLRGLLWLLLAVGPVWVIWGVARGRLDLFDAEIASGIWVALFFAACRWGQLILFSVPSAPLRLLAALFSSYAPRSLQFGEQLKMAEEDNVGDPKPAMEVFGYVPESFEQGIKLLLGK